MIGHIRSAYLFVALGTSALAQFNNLRPTDDGLFFTSLLRLKNETSTAGTNRLYRTSGGPVNSLGSLGSGAVELSVSRDGQWYAVTTTFHTKFKNIVGSQVVGPSFRYSTDVKVQISKNGRFWVVGFFGPGAVYDNVTTTWRTFEGTGFISGIANDGTVLDVEKDRYTLFRQAGPIDFVRPAGSSEETLNESGNAILYRSEDGIHTIDTASGVDQLRAPVRQDGCAAEYESSEDGGVLLFHGKDEVGDCQAFGSFGIDTEPRVLTKLSGGVVSCALDRTSALVCATRLDNRIVRVDLVTGDLSEIVPRTPIVQAALPCVASNSYLQLVGVGLVDHSSRAESPLSTTLDGFSARIGPTDALVASTAPDRVELLTSTDLDFSQGYFPVEVPTGNSPLVGPPALAYTCKFLVGSVEGFFQTGPIHADSGIVVDRNHPARVREVVQVFGVGFGSTSPTVPAGQPAPADPPAELTSKVVCRLREGELETTFQGLQPGFYGLYRIDVRMPDTLPGLTQQPVVCNGTNAGILYLAQKN